MQAYISCAGLTCAWPVAHSIFYVRVANVRTASWISAWRDNSSTFQLSLLVEYANLTWLGGISSYGKIVPRRNSPQARTSRKVRGGHSRTLRVADAGGRFSVFSAAEVPPIRLGSAQDRRGLPRNKFSPPSPRRIPRRKFLFRQK